MFGLGPLFNLKNAFYTISPPGTAHFGVAELPHLFEHLIEDHLVMPFGPCIYKAVVRPLVNSAYLLRHHHIRIDQYDRISEQRDNKGKGHCRDIRHITHQQRADRSSYR